MATLRSLFKVIPSSAAFKPSRRCLSAAISHTALQKPDLIGKLGLLTSTVRKMGSISYSPPSVKIGSPAPSFSAGAVVDGEITKIDLAQYKGKYVVLLFYPKDFTFVCPTEIIAFSDATDKFAALNTQVIALSTDTEESHLAWIRTPRKKGGLGHMRIPIVADVTKTISADYGVLHEEIGIALRGLFLINPTGTVEQITVNNFPVGRSVDETIRLIQAFQYVAEHGEVCPANWKPGAKTMVPETDASLAYFSTGATEAADDDDDDPLDAGEKVVAIKSPQDYYNVIKEEKVVVDFVAPWCGKCRQITPFVKKLSEDYPSVTFAKFDTTEDTLTELGAELGVKVLPSFHFFKNGKPAGEPITGYKKKPLQEQVEKLL